MASYATHGTACSHGPEDPPACPIHEALSIDETVAHRRWSQSSKLCLAPALRIQKSLRVNGSQFNTGGAKRLASRPSPPRAERSPREKAQSCRAYSRCSLPDARPARPGRTRSAHVSLAATPRPRGGHFLQHASGTSRGDARRHGCWSLCGKLGGRAECAVKRGEGGSAGTSPSRQFRTSAATHLSLPPRHRRRPPTHPLPARVRGRAVCRRAARR